MLVTIYAGRDTDNAVARGDMHFDQPPHPGDRVRIDDQILTVRNTWHMPGTTFAGPKYGILIDALGVAA